MLFCILILSTISATFANNVTITNVSVVGGSNLTFTISWENSWRVSTPPYNHDAVWVFVKRRDCASNVWSHVNLDTTASNHSASSPLMVYFDDRRISGDPAKGIYLKRSSDGVGNIPSTTVTLKMVDIPTGDFDFSVMGIEMVNIPTGNFYLGDGSTASINANARGAFITNTGIPYLVQSENSISNTNLSSTNTSAEPVVSLPAEYPKGYAEFHCMKYEITQGQYIDFLNMITNDQFNERNNNIATGVWPNVSAPFPTRAIDLFSWMDLCAYLDWSALRPMTELEYEKLCRGPVNPVINEFAWGSSTVTPVPPGWLSGSGATEKLDTSYHGPANFNSQTVGKRIYRSGFAAISTSTRVSSGAGYYGVMNLSDNVTEFVVNAAHATTAQSFEGNVGDGELTFLVAPFGCADVSDWPSTILTINSTLVDAFGVGIRGGGFETPLSSGIYNQGFVSDRSRCDWHRRSRNIQVGGRGVR